MSCASKRGKHAREKTTSSSSRVCPFISNVIGLLKPETLFMQLNTTSLLKTFLVKWQKRKSSCRSCWGRVFLSCEKHLSHLWDVWKIKSKRKIGILLYIKLLLMDSLNLKNVLCFRILRQVSIGWFTTTTPESMRPWEWANTSQRMALSQF